MLSRKGVPRVVWERQRSGSDDKDTEQFDLVPFLSVSRSLGDFWSFSRKTKNFVVSPKPDVHVHPLDPSEQKFIVVATDGLWNVMSPQEVVEFIWDYEHDDQKCHQPRDVVRAVINEGLQRWSARNLLADNIAVLIAFLSEDESSCQASLSGLSNCTGPVNGDVTMTSSEGTSSPTPSSETGITCEPRENPESSSSSATTSPSVVKHMSQTKTGSTVYYKESLPDGVMVEYQTTITLRHRRKEKHRPGREDSKSKKMNGATDVKRNTGPAEREQLGITENGGEIGLESRPLKRRQRDEDSVEPPPPVKRTKAEDSGCEVDMAAADKPAAVDDKSSPGSDSSSGVFSDENEVTRGPSEHALHSRLALVQVYDKEWV